MAGLAVTLVGLMMETTAMLPKWNLAEIRALMFNRPLLVTQDRALAALGVMGPKLDVRALVTGEGSALSIDQLKAKAAAAKSEVDDLPGDDQLRKYDYNWDTGAVVEKAPYEVWNGIAIFDVRGTLMAEHGIDPYSGATGYDGLSRKARHARANPAVRGGVLDIDSGGGDVTGLAEAAAHFLAFAAEKPLRAVIRGSGCSAAYYLAACAGPGNITAADYSVVGSIGAIMMHADFSKQLAEDGIEVTLITSDEHKADGSWTKPLAEDVHAKLQGMVSACAAGFIDHVASARQVDRAGIAAQQAAFFSGQAALDLGLVDKFMSWDDSMKEFAATVNASGSRPGTPAPSGARSAKGTSMSNANANPAAEQPEFNPAQLDAAVATGRTEASAAAVSEAQADERARFAALVELDAASTISPALAAAMADGTDAGAFAIAQLAAAKAAGSNALNAAKAEATPAAELPQGGAAAAAAIGVAAEVNRGAAYAQKRQAKSA